MPVGSEDVTEAAVFWLVNSGGASAAACSSSASPGDSLGKRGKIFQHVKNKKIDIYTTEGKHRVTQQHQTSVFKVTLCDLFIDSLCPKIFVLIQTMI